MAKVRIVLNQRNIDRIDTLPTTIADLTARTSAIADACNSQSSWGGYDSEVEITEAGPVGRVWSFDEAADEARQQRLLRNLGEGR